MRSLRFDRVPGLAQDISISPEGTPWVVGTNPVGRQGDYGILYWEGRNWVDTRGGGLRIAAGPQGSACAVNARGEIYLYERQVWTQLPGGAIDASVGNGGQLCVLGNEQVSQQGDYGVWHWSGQTWTPLGGGGVRLAIGADGSVWVVNSAGEVWVYQRQTWNGPLPGLGIDIAAGGDGSVWLIGTNQVSPTGDRGLYRWNGQDWAPMGGGGLNVAAGPDGRPWVTNAAYEIYCGS